VKEVQARILPRDPPAAGGSFPRRVAGGMMVGGWRVEAGRVAGGVGPGIRLPRNMCYAWSGLEPPSCLFTKEQDPGSLANRQHAKAWPQQTCNPISPSLTLPKPNVVKPHLKTLRNQYLYLMEEMV